MTDISPSSEIVNSGFISILGRPNAGKSTLLNRLSSMHLAIVSPKPQTTRHAIRCIVDDDTSQIVFVDTPGLHKPDSKLGEKMQESAWKALGDADAVLLMIDAERPGPSVLEREVCSRCAAYGKELFLAVNKADKVPKPSLLPIIARYAALHPFQAIIPISARTGDGVDVLLDELRKTLPMGPRYFPRDTLTDQTERVLAAELIRESALRELKEEVPHGVGVLVERFEELRNGEPAGEDDRDRVSIGAVLYCEKETHKGILIGKGGSMLKKIGTNARTRIEEMTGCPVYLELLVKVREDWRNRKGILADLGYGEEK
ncbi:MAG: GTPase Era [Clostridiaceae bacterium]|nr:GTPase Era [Clostridiaceae bacterium]